MKNDVSQSERASAADVEEDLKNMFTSRGSTSAAEGFPSGEVPKVKRVSETERERLKSNKQF